MSYIYLWLNILSFLPPFLLSFHPLLQLHKRWQYLLPAIFIVAIIFVLLDMWYTSMGIWGFSSRYLLGANIANLPIEEVLFFICIPYACIFSYHCLNTQLKRDFFGPIQNAISYSLMLFSAIMLILFYHKVYTLFAFGSVLLLIFLLQVILKVKWLSRFYFAYLILQIPFLIVNGILTGTGLKEPIVWYNPSHIIGWRILTIPFEDIFYGMAMLLMSIAIYEYLQIKKENKMLL